jgi:hypothetical protein
LCSASLAAAPEEKVERGVTVERVTPEVTGGDAGCNERGKRNERPRRSHGKKYRR